MGDNSAIEWTDATWNPIAGCSKVSPGCDGCYAIRVSHRLAGNPNPKIHGKHENLTDENEHGELDWTGEVRLWEPALDQPLRWPRPRRIFVNSLSDLFHPGLTDDSIARVFAVMALAPQHTFQVLTKRPQRMAEVLGRWGESGYAMEELESAITERVEAMDRSGQAVPLSDEFAWPLPNVWLGTSIESDRWTFRADHLRRTPAAVRFVSAEPLLGPLPSLDLTGIDWLIVGGESGHNARPVHPDWVRDLRDRCRRPFVRNGDTLDDCDSCGEEYDDPCPEHRVAFFFKQWGEWVPAAFGEDFDMKLTMDGEVWHRDAQLANVPVRVRRVGKKAAGRVLDGETWDEVPVVVGVRCDG